MNMAQYVILMIMMGIVQFSTLIAGDVPKTMSYQAIIRNGNQGLIVNGTVSVRISILKNSEFGSPVYVERHSAKTNANGLLTLHIGAGNPLFGAFQSIEWVNGPYFLRTETDPLGGTEYGITTVSQILTVPYAIQAHKSLHADSVKHERDPLFTKSVAAAITAQDTARWNAKLLNELDPVFSASAAALLDTTYLQRIDSALTVESDPVFMAWDKDYADLTNKPTTNGSETKVTGSGVISVTGNGTTATPYSIAMKPMVMNVTIDSTNTVVLQGTASLIIIQSNNDGAIDRITLPTTGETGQVLYVIHKRTTQGDAPEINLEGLNGNNFTYVYADGGWKIFSEL